MKILTPDNILLGSTIAVGAGMLAYVIIGAIKFRKTIGSNITYEILPTETKKTESPANVDISQAVKMATENMDNRLQY